MEEDRMRLVQFTKVGDTKIWVNPEAVTAVEYYGPESEELVSIFLQGKGEVRVKLTLERVVEMLAAGSR